jgi:hypothetical protein
VTVPQPPRPSARGPHPADGYPGGQNPGGPYPAGQYAAGGRPGPSSGGPSSGDPLPPGPYSGGPEFGSPGSAGAGPYEDIGEVSVGELVGNVTRDLSTLMRQELALAQAELKAEASKTGKAAGALGAAGFAGYMAVLFASICLWWALGNLIGNGWSALVVAVLWGIAGAVLYAGGRKKLREVHPTPERTVDTLKNVPDALRGEVGGHR